MALYYKRVGIIGALDEEVAALISSITLLSNGEFLPETHELNASYHFGKIKNQEVVVVRCGVGKVNSSICAQHLIDKYKVNAIISMGVAGGVSPAVKQNDVIISEAHLHHDMRGFGAPSIIPMMENASTFKSNEGLVECAKRACEKAIEPGCWHVGLNVSGDEFVQSNEKRDWLYKTFGALCCEMEGAGVAHTCAVNTLPFLGVRAISDSANEQAISTFEENKANAIKQLTAVVMGML